MKDHIKKAIENVAQKKQETFEVAEGNLPEEIHPKKKALRKPTSTYWVCVNEHVFEHKYRVHPDRENKLRCQICGKPIRNKTTKSTYLYYLKKEGRVDLKQYRAEQRRKEKEQQKRAIKLDREFNKDVRED